jgi:RNA polymerase sigma-70 factor (ECF subfamily)
MQSLCETYYGPILAFLRRTGLGEEDVRDTAHAFIGELMGSDGFRGLERGQGRFRSYLLGALKHFVANQRARQQREKRGGMVEHVSIGGTSDTEEPIAIPASGTNLDAWFDREWALNLVERGLARLENEAKADGRLSQFEALKPWLTLNQTPASQVEAAHQLGLSEGALKVAVHRLRRRFRELVRVEIAQTLDRPDDIDAEMRHLVDALATES